MTESLLIPFPGTASVASNYDDVPLVVLAPSDEVDAQTAQY
jgi:hypothetical protein